MDDYLAPVLVVAEEDGLEHLRGVLSEDLTDDDRHDLVALIIDLAGALEPLLRDAALSRERGEAAYSAARALGGASDLALAEILRLLDSD
ncbi:MAG: hypothetical protein QF464_20700, partial [Myxococcota bacterium]|nr:hypothetical protein [Myxococcota bacterium]